MKMSELCDSTFFEDVATQFNVLGYEDLKTFIYNNSDSLAYNIKFNYNMPVLDEFKDESQHYLALFFANKYGDSLSRVFEALTIKYGVLDNTDVTTVVDRDMGDDITFGKRIDRKGNDTFRHGGKDTTTNRVQSDNYNNFSTTYDDVSDATGKKPTTNSTHDSISTIEQDYNSHNISEYNSYTQDSGDENRDVTEDITTHRKGNIGITPNQRLVELELNLRAKNKIFDYITSMIVQTFSSGTWGD